MCGILVFRAISSTGKFPWFLQISDSRMFGFPRGKNISVRNSDLVVVEVEVLNPFVNGDIPLPQATTYFSSYLLTHSYSLQRQNSTLHLRASHWKTSARSEAAVSTTCKRRKMGREGLKWLMGRDGWGRWRTRARPVRPPQLATPAAVRGSAAEVRRSALARF